MATIGNVKDSLTGMLHGQTLNKIKNINRLFQRAGDSLLSRIDPPETIRISQISNAIHEEIYDYTAPSDLKDEKVIDIRPQVNRTSSDNPMQYFSKPFDLKKANNGFAIRYDTGTKSLRFSKDVSPNRKVLHNMNSLTANGSWSADGADASNLTVDTLNYAQGNASFNFDLTGSGMTGYIENSDMTAVDLSDEENQAKIFVWVYIPDTSIITNFILYWGSSSSAYWSATVTSPHDVSSFKTGWQLLAFDWNGATETGSPSSSAINYLRLTVTYDGTADTDLRVDEISCSRGEIFEIEYYSNYLFRTSSGVWQENTSDDTDILNLGNDGVQIYTLECLKACAQQIQGVDSGFDMNYVENELSGLEGLYTKYKFEHPSQAIKKKDYYRPLRFTGTRASFLR